MKKTNKNFLYNLAYQLFVFIIPLVTTPYISRRLGVENVGIYSYTYSIIYYFMLGSMLGINNYGAREIAKVSSDKEKRSKKFFEIYFMQIFFTLMMIILFIIYYNVISYEYKNILLIQFIFIISCAFDINWFFFGMEKFKITISRNIIIKLLSLVCIFTFVKDSNDLGIYSLILSLSTLISQIYLFIFLKKEIVATKISCKDIVKHFKPCLILFIPVIAYSIYRVMDKTMIGHYSNNIELGNYESAEKIINIPLSIITALGTVMMPHMSKSSDSEFDKKIEETYKLCFFIVFPIIMGLLIVSNDFCQIFFGNEFTLTSNIIKLLLITILFSCVTNITRNNYLIPKSLDKIYVRSTIYGAIVNFILNFIFIRKYGAYGACIGTIAAELCVMAYQVFSTRKDIKYLNNIKKVLPFLLKSLIMMIAIYIIGLFIKQVYFKIILQFILGIIIYFSLNIKYIFYEFLGLKKKNVK